jgi:glycosyltransferase involved in cell wall biosynthesis
VIVPPGPPVRVLRVIARLNVGGPAHHVTLLSAGLDPERYETLLLAGTTGAGEGSFDGLAEARGVLLRRVPGLGPALRPVDDLRALLALMRHVHRFRPDIVHTHTAKAGLLGRLAARITPGRRPSVVLHTYHGHVLRGYFSPRVTAVYRLLEQLLSRITTRLIGVSEATVDELVCLGVAPRSKFVTVPIGLDLAPYLAVEPDARWRTEFGMAPGALVLTFVGRLVPIKRVDLLIDAVAQARATGVDVQLVIAGDGPLRPTLEARAAPLGSAVRFLGFRGDLPAIAAGSDVAILTSDSEGTPVALIEAAAAGLPAIATDVGGVRDIVDDGVTGWLVQPGSVAALSAAIVRAVDRRDALSSMGVAARDHVRERFAADRLLADIDALYGELLGVTHQPV